MEILINPGVQGLLAVLIIAVTVLGLVWLDGRTPGPTGGDDQDEARDDKTLGPSMDDALFMEYLLTWCFQQMRRNDEKVTYRRAIMFPFETVRVNLAPDDVQLAVDMGMIWLEGEGGRFRLTRKAVLYVQQEYKFEVYDD